MASRLAFLLVLVTVAVASQASSALAVATLASKNHWVLTRYTSGDGGLDVGGADGVAGTRTCNGLVGDCIDEDEEMAMGSEVSRRGLRRRGRYISYDALRRDRVPCSQRGQSYYNCQPQARANPYRRACTAATRCARYLY